MEFITIEMLLTAGGATTAVTTLTQGVKMLAKRYKYKIAPKSVAFILSMILAAILVVHQGDYSAVHIFLAIVNGFIVWLASIGAFEVSKEVEEHRHKKDDDKPQG